MRIYPVIVAGGVLTVFLFFASVPQESEALYPYAIRGYITDVRHKPHLFIGGWLLKKAIILKLIKIKLILKKKLIIKKIIKKILFKLIIGRRKKRSIGGGVDYQDEDYQLPAEPTDNDINNYFQMSKELDTEGCIAKGICQVLQNRGNITNLNQFAQSNEFENIIQQYFSNKDIDRVDSQPGSAEYIYDYAAYMGRNARQSHGECDRLFPQCQEQPQRLNKYLQMSFASESEMCDGPSYTQNDFSNNDFAHYPQDYSHNNQQQQFQGGFNNNNNPLASGGGQQQFQQQNNFNANVQHPRPPLVAQQHQQPSRNRQQSSSTSNTSGTGAIRFES